MSVQTSYADAPSTAFEGMLTGNKHDIMTMISVEASAQIPFGKFVKFKASNTADTDALLPVATSDKLAGIVILTNEYQRTYTLADGSTGGELGTTGLLPGAVLNVLRRGQIWVRTEAACVPGDRMFVRIDAGEAAEILGSVSNAADESDMINASTQGVFLTTAGIGGLAILELDMEAFPVSGFQGVA